MENDQDWSNLSSDELTDAIEGWTELYDSDSNGTLSAAELAKGLTT